MTLVAELDGLVACDVHLRDPRRRVDAIEKPEKRGHGEHRPEDAEFRDGVGTAVEDLRHRSAIHGSRNRCVQTQSLLTRRGRDLRSIARTKCVVREPRELGVRLEDLMAELEPLMTFARRHIKMGGYSV